MSFDPNLKDAMSEIEAVCRKYDCGGFISLASKTHGEFRYVLPDWVLIEIIETKSDRQAWHVKIRRSLPKETELTAWFILQLRDIGANLFKSMQQAAEVLMRHMKIEHTPFANYEPHDPEDPSKKH